MKLKIEIKNRWTGKAIFEFETENNTMAKTIAEYIRVELEEKEKYRANLTDADLTRADLTGADLTDANLTDANLTRANLTRADLTRANLTRANLTRANLTDADLTDANLTDADLTRADLTDANLLRFKNDLWRVLLISQSEISGLRKALVDGKINGSKYEGDCCCLKGTIANVKGCSYTNIPGLRADISEPSEQWFLQISPDDTPKTSNVVKLTVEWIDEFLTYINLYSF